MISSRQTWHYSTGELLEKRAWLYETIRTFMQERDILEVETPVLHTAGNTDPNIDSITVTTKLPGTSKPLRYFMHTSPEFFMKRLIAKGHGSIYQICKVFRDGESGPLHRPEFSMLEYYRTGFDYHQLMDELNELLGSTGLERATRETYASVFETATGINPHSAGMDVLSDYAGELGAHENIHSRSGLLDLIFSHQVGPGLGRTSPVFIHDYPVCQAALASIAGVEPGLAQRFELFINGIEICNGYNELQSISNYVSRFEKDNDERKTQAKPVMQLDDSFIQDLQNDLPACSGVAVGLDRLLMVVMGSNSIEDVLAFP